MYVHRNGHVWHRTFYTSPLAMVACGATIYVMTLTTTEHADMSRQAYAWAQAALITAGALVFIIGLAFLVWDSATRMTG
jgi:hypothetical protein